MSLLKLGEGSLRLLRRTSVAVVGGILVGLGLLLVVTPGPAVVVIPAGLAVLAVEFEAPRRWLSKLRRALARRNAGPPPR